MKTFLFIYLLWLETSARPKNDAVHQQVNFYILFFLSFNIISHEN